jgi:hypothetical protein
MTTRRSSGHRRLVNEIVAKRMNKKQQMCWMLNDTLENALRHRYPGFRSANDDQAPPAAA